MDRRRVDSKPIQQRSNVDPPYPLKVIWGSSNYNGTKRRNKSSHCLATAHKWVHFTTGEDNNLNSNNHAPNSERRGIHTTRSECNVHNCTKEAVLQYGSFYLRQTYPLPTVFADEQKEVHWLIKVQAPPTGTTRRNDHDTVKEPIFRPEHRGPPITKHS